MRKIILLSFLLISFSGFTQDWAPFKITDTLRQLVAEDSMQVQLRLRYIRPIQSVSAQSFTISANETMVVFQKGYSALKLFYSTPFVPPFGLVTSADKIKGRILGDTARIYSDSSMYTSIDSLGFTLKFYHSYKQGAVWEFGRSIDFELVGTVDSLYTDSIGGTVDSIAKISLVVLDFMPFVVDSHPFNNQEILISKNHGLISTLDFTHLTDSSFKYNYYDGLQDSILLNDHAALTVGDEFHFQTTENVYGPYLYSKINNRISVVADSIIGTRRTVDYKLEKLRVTPVYQTFVDIFYSREFELDSVYATNKSMIDDPNSAQFSFTQLLGVSSTTGCVKLVQSYLGANEFTFRYKGLSNKPDSISFVGGGLAGGSSNAFIGVGAESYSYGHGGIGASTLEETIMYIQKGNQTWGTPLNLSVALGEEIQDNNELTLYPNPVNEVLKINSKANYSSIEILKVNGQLVATFTKQETYNVSELSSGVYFLRVIADDGVTAKKFVKE